MYLQTIATACVLAATAISNADIGFPAAIDISRATAPADYTLLQTVLRDRNGVLNYESDLYSAGAVSEFEVRINPETGEVTHASMQTPSISDQGQAAAVLARWDEVLIDFVDALAAVAVVDPDAAPFKIQLDIQDGVVVYQVEVTNTDQTEAKYYVNAGSGVIHDNNDGNDNETASDKAFVMAINVAVKATGAVPLEAEAEFSNTTSQIEVLLFDEATGNLIEMRISATTGEILSSETYTPGPSQMERIAEILAALPDATVSFGDALMIAHAAFPESAAHEIELKIENSNLIYDIELILASMEIDFHVDAVTGGTSTANSTAPTLGDLNLDGVVNVSDLLEIITMWNSINPAYDLDGDGVVGVGDILVIIAHFGM